MEEKINYNVISENFTIPDSTSCYPSAPPLNTIMEETIAPPIQSQIPIPFVPSVPNCSNVVGQTVNSVTTPIICDQIPTYKPPQPSILSATEQQSSLITPTDTNTIPPLPPVYQLPNFTPPVVPQSLPTQGHQPIYCSDGVIYPSELQSQPSEESNDQQLTLPNELVDIYNHLGIVGKILTSGSIVTIRFLQMFRNLSESLVDALGIARPKYEGEIKAFEEMKQEEKQRQMEIEKLYATWTGKPLVESTPAIDTSAASQMTNYVMPPAPPQLPPPPPSTTSPYNTMANINMNYMPPQSP